MSVAGPDWRSDSGVAAEVEHLRLAVEIADVTVAEVVAPGDRQVVVGGMRLHYLDWGGGPAAPAVFLHGGGLNARSWDVVCLASRERHHCYALDLRGHGDSEWSPGLEYTLDDHLRDVEGFIEHLGLSRFVIVGQSLGALVAIKYAARHPDLVVALVAVDAGPFVRENAGTDRIRAFGRDRERFDSLDEAVEYAAAFNPRRDRRLLRHSLGQALRALPDGGWTWKRDRRHLSDATYASMVREMRSTVPEARAIGCPTLVVRGADSDVFSADEAARFADLVPDGLWTTVEGAGHTIQGDNPAGLVDALCSFLAARDETAIAYLGTLGARGISHPGGNLLDHLRRTAGLLTEWRARPALVSAGLYHAVYGTDGFSARLRTLDQRHQIAERIGPEAEGIVYRYASCDRAYLFPQLGVEEHPAFLDRFTAGVSRPGPGELSDFLELTFANELDQIAASPAFAAENAAKIAALLRGCVQLVSVPAREAFTTMSEAVTGG